jgi:iron complex outermembrane recepter protein
MNRSLCSALLALLMLSAGTTAAGAESDETSSSATATADTGTLQEIVVTARRRAEDLQSVPLTVNAFTASAIQTQNITNLEDLGSLVPNIKISQDRATSSTINVYIRGVGQSDPLWGFEPGVGVYIDDVTWRAPRRLCWMCSISIGSRC